MASQDPSLLRAAISRFSRIGIFLAVGTFLLPAVSHATPSLSGSGRLFQGSLSNSGGSCFFDSSTSFDDNQFHSLANLCDAPGEGYANGYAEGQVDYGTLRGLAYASIWYLGDSWSDVNLAWNDELTITGSLPSGSPVTLLFTVNLGVDYTSIRSGGGVGRGNYASTLFEVSPPFSPNRVDLLSSYISGVTHDDQTGSLMWTSYVGDTIPISQTLHVSSWVEAPVPGAYAKRIVDASNTATLEIEVLTPGASYVSASNHTYGAATPVPEPVTSLLLGSGLVAMIAWRRFGKW
jgi:hypothetical protein